MQYVEKVRSYVKVMPIGDAVDRAVKECIEQGILREFLLRNKAEVKHMSICEYDEEASRKALREYAYEEGEKSGEAKGEKKGRINSILLLLEDIGPVPAEVREEITALWLMPSLQKNNALTYYQNDSIITIATDNIILIITKGGENHEYQVQKI